MGRRLLAWFSLTVLAASSPARVEEGGVTGDDVQAAIDAALGWLVRNQSDEGNWEIKRWGGDCPEEATVGVTALGLLAFVRAGHTDRRGSFKWNVLRALNYLLSNQADDGCIGENNRSPYGGYNHAIAGIALAEVYAASRSREIALAAHRAVSYSIEVHRGRFGGWRYSPGSTGDTCVTGWFVTQLRATVTAGIRVDPKGFQGALVFLDKVTDEESGRARYGYRAGDDHTAPMTAVATYCRQIMGRYRRNAPVLERVADYLLEHPPGWQGTDKEDFYYWYYGTLVMSRIGGERWRTWKTKLHNLLVRGQRRAPDDPERDGSWEPNGYSGRYGGRAYATAMACLTLEIREGEDRTRNPRRGRR